MPCSFCRSNYHTKRDCNNPQVVAFQVSYVKRINRLITNAYVRRNSPLVLKRDMEEWLSNVSLEHLKIIFQYLKRNTRLNINGYYILKRQVILVILQIVFYDCGIDIQSAYIPDLANLYVPESSSAAAANTPRVPPVASAAPIVPPTTETHNERIARISAQNVAPAPVERSFNNTTSLTERAFRDLIITPPVVRPKKVVILKFDEVCENNDECPVCYDGLKIESFVKLNCSHKYCKECIKKCMSSCKLDCPMCRAPITTIFTQNPVVSTYSL